MKYSAIRREGAGRQCPGSCQLAAPRWKGADAWLLQRASTRAVRGGTSLAGMTAWDELREALARLLAEQPGALQGYPGLDPQPPGPPPHHAQPGPDGRPVDGRVEPEDAQLTGRGRGDRADHPHRRALA